jgi:hypothetical protein
MMDDSALAGRHRTKMATIITTEIMRQGKNLKLLLLALLARLHTKTGEDNCYFQTGGKDLQHLLERKRDRAVSTC